MIEAITWYMESVAAFWSSFARGGILQLLMIGFVIWWVFCRRGRSCCCSSCGCWCGRCRCRGGHKHHHHHDEAHEDADGDANGDGTDD